MVALYVLLILMIIGAIVAIEVKNLLSSVAAVGVVGLCLSLVCLILQAPDVAITQLVVEILSLIIMIRATLYRDLPRSPTGGFRWGAVAAVIFSVMLLWVAAGALAELPPFGSPIMRISNIYLADGLPKTGAPNIVSAILLDFRGYDTLGEATILFTAVVGVLAVTRRWGKKKENTSPEAPHE